MGTLWQGVGGFIYSGKNLDDEQLGGFAEACQGGRTWLVPVVYGDDEAGPWNLANLDALRGRASNVGIHIVGGWLNGTGLPADEEADRMGQLIADHDLSLAILDLEGGYQYPGGDPNLMPALVAALRDRFPRLDLGVSTDGMNNSMIWNGRTLTPARSFAKLGVRVLPQWAYGPAYSGCWVEPECNMKWLHDNGAAAGNFIDPSRPNKRGLPLSLVHATIEGTGDEGADFGQGLAKLERARAYGYTFGFSYYTLEKAPLSDFPLIAGCRGSLWK